jgi:hypothetical protein
MVRNLLALNFNVEVVTIMNRKSFSRFTLMLPLMASLSLGAQLAYADVTPAPEHPGHHNVAAQSPEEHLAAAEHHKKAAEYHHGMAKHHHSMAAEHKKHHHHKLAKHHTTIANHHTALAKEHEALAKTHEEHAAKGK